MLRRSRAGLGRLADKIVVEGGAQPNLSILEPEEARVPWQGHTALYALPAVYEEIKAHKTTLLFVNTRWQAELLFSELWRVNEDSLAIALHHGSLDRGQRRKVEAAMVAGKLRAVVATSTLDLGIDWGDVDLVVHVGAPKGASRLAQRIGRANHRMDEPSKGMLVPGNRFEVLECRAALDANYLGHQDTPPLRAGTLDVLCQHILGMAVAEPFDAVALHDEITTAAPYRELDWETFERAVDFVATGGYALRSYERYAKIRRRKDGPDKGRFGHHASADRAAIPAERRHHHRAADAQGAPRPSRAPASVARRARARADRGIFPGAAHAGRHLPLRRPRAALRGHPRERGLRQPRRQGGRVDPLLRGREVPAHHLPRFTGARDPRRPDALVGAAGAGARVARLSEGALGAAGSRPTFWSRRFRTGTSSTWRRSPSRGGSRIRRSACF